MGDHNGPNMFLRLKEAIDEYNATNEDSGGKAKLQIYKTDNDTDLSDIEDSNPPPKKKLKLKKRTTQPLIITVCTPLMARANENISQAREMIFCDSTSSLDHFNTSMFILSTSTPTSAVPLGVIITSDEQLSTIKQGLEMLADTLPQKAFFGNGAHNGPTMIMTDDSSSERGAIKEFWPAATLLLCTFHFL